ncbi:MAG TPA: hypothetical protein VH351_17935 [Bryobacteraceae bacterium]|nr:hypothetical protein [Bryobacteraceae bacterium]
MPEQISKLTPNRDLQCYFLTPSAIAAMSGASANGYTLSGKWRQQFDWAVVEWNRDNVFEHPSLRNLPDGDLSGLMLTYNEKRKNCIPIESNLVPIVDWNTLRIWAADDKGVENLYRVNLWPDYATPSEGSYVSASATMTLTASPGAGNRVGLAFLESHHYYTVGPQDTLAQIAQGIATDVNANPDFSASSNGASVTVTWKSGPNWAALRGANGNRITMYGFAENGVACWSQPSAAFSGGQFPGQYKITIDFGALKRQLGIPTNRVRKLRWTWAADLQAGTFNQTEFEVNISEWSVTGTNAQYFVAGPGSRRIEDTDSSAVFSGTWDIQQGNYSISRIHHSSTPGSSCTFTYSETASHDLYLGTRLLTNGATIALQVDGQTQTTLNTSLAGEDILIRSKIGTLPAGTHVLKVTHAGPSGADLFVDFLEIAYPSANLPDVSAQTGLSLATDWDTYHSQALPAERTAWLINKLGFSGRVNHYAGALWFYELVRPGTQYASLTLTFSAESYTGSPTVVLAIAAASPPGQQAAAATLISHLALPDDTVATVAEALAALINLGTNSVWATADGAQLTVTARAMGTYGNGISVQLDPSSSGFSVTAPTTTLGGGIDGAPYSLDTSNPLNATLIAAADYWRTDLMATPRLNRAARDWHQAFFTALKGYGMDCVASFSMELGNGDPSPAAGILQQYPDSTPVVLNTPSVQTNFSPASLNYWKQVYLDMAQLQANAGMTPYLQFGEVQWWYFPNQAGMPFYDSYTQQQFQASYGTPIKIITSNTEDPTKYPNECIFLPQLIGTYTASIRSAVQTSFPGSRYEVLYPTDTNDTPLNQIINYPANDWTASNLMCLKTESFTFTNNYNLDQSLYSIGVSAAKGFASNSRSHLVGIADAWSPWMKEIDLAQAQGLESVVLFALDQFCLIGYPVAPFISERKTRRQG